MGVRAVFKELGVGSDVNGFFVIICLDRSCDDIQAYAETTKGLWERAAT